MGRAIVTLLEMAQVKMYLWVIGSLLVSVLVFVLFAMFDNEEDDPY
mgnify:FL=1